jgi:hypothetical protein
MFFHGAECGILLLLLFKHAEHLFFGSRQFIFEVLIFSLNFEHSLCDFLRRVSYHLIHVNNGLDMFGFGAEIQSLLGFLIVLVQLTHGADD